MENAPRLDGAWSTISPTTAPPQLLSLDTLHAAEVGGVTLYCSTYMFHFARVKLLTRIAWMVASSSAKGAL